MTARQRILIIEDEPNVRRMMQMTLQSPRRDITTAPDGPAGLGEFGNGFGWDVVVLDQRMPGMEGLEVLREIKARTTAVPVVMVTAYPSIDLAIDAMRLGATDFIRKPLTPDILRTAVDAAMRVRPAMTTPAMPEGDAPAVELLTLNGFRIVHLPSDPHDFTHRFHVMQGADDEGTVFEVPIEQAAVDRLNQFTGARHQPGGSFWASRAEELLAAVVWTEGRLPPPGTLTVKDFSRLELDQALGWPGDPV